MSETERMRSGFFKGVRVGFLAASFKFKKGNNAYRVQRKERFEEERKERRWNDFQENRRSSFVDTACRTLVKLITHNGPSEMYHETLEIILRYPEADGVLLNYLDNFLHMQRGGVLIYPTAPFLIVSHFCSKIMNFWFYQPEWRSMRLLNLLIMSQERLEDLHGEDYFFLIISPIIVTILEMTDTIYRHNSTNGPIQVLTRSLFLLRQLLPKFVCGPCKDLDSLRSREWVFSCFTVMIVYQLGGFIPKIRSFLFPCCQSLIKTMLHEAEKAEIIAGKEAWAGTVQGCLNFFNAVYQFHPDAEKGFPQRTCNSDAPLFNKMVMALEDWLPCFQAEE